MISKSKVAIIGFACKYPDANNTQEFWENILSGRRAFRNMPAKRLSSSYFSDNKNDVDYIYSKKVAVLKNYVFDRIKYKISNSNFLTADFTHWLALDVASTALDNSLSQELLNLNKDKVGVIIGNTLTGEFSRANTLRLRWPYIEKILGNTLTKNFNDQEKVIDILKAIEEDYKKAFPVMEEDSLAGALSNTIAGRICNYFDFKGGGYTIDGACSSSLLATSKACDAITNKDLLIAIVGGIDLSLDPFELVGFSRAGALAKKEMLIFDEQSNGFWPGEGCGFVILTDYNFAVKNKLNIIASIKGWGISSDGSGGLTRPNVEGQSLAIERAYQKTNYSLDDIDYIEGHGTGTFVGDETELKTIIKSIKNRVKPLYLGSVKANIGHTKASAGIAGLIKNLLIIQNNIIPPITGCKNPHHLLKENSEIIVVPNSPIIHKGSQPMKVALSSMGFGGINVHMTMEGETRPKKESFTKKEKILCSSIQDTELFVFSEDTKELLKKKLDVILNVSDKLSLSEMTDISCSLFADLKKETYRLAIEASSQEQLKDKLLKAITYIDTPLQELLDTKYGIYYSNNERKPQIGFLFPGQGNIAHNNRTMIMRRFPFIESIETQIPEFKHNMNNGLRADFAHATIVRSSINSIKFLQKLGINADVSIGHSLGEYTALFYGGILSGDDVLHVVDERGKLIQESPEVKGAMLVVEINQNDSFIKSAMNNYNVSLAAINSNDQVVFSGNIDSIEKLRKDCDSQKIPSVWLKVENAFHSSMMKCLEPAFERILDEILFKAPKKRTVSSITGKLIENKNEIKKDLLLQLTNPVLFYEAFIKADPNIDIWIEVGIGNTLTKLVTTISDKPIISFDLANDSFKGLLNLSGILFAKGNDSHLEWIFKNRFFRKYDFDEKNLFIENPCERIEYDFKELRHENVQKIENTLTVQKNVLINTESGINLIFKKELSEKLQLPVESINSKNRMLDDFHLNSLYVGHFLSDFSNKFNLKLTNIPSEYSNATVDEITEMFLNLNRENIKNEISINDQKETEEEIKGISTWIHPYEIIKTEASIEKKKQTVHQESSWSISGDLTSLNPDIIREINKIPSKGILVLLFETEETDLIHTLLHFTGEVKKNPDLTHVVFIQSNPIATGFAKSFYLEQKHLNTLVFNIPKIDFDVEVLKEEVINTIGFSEVFYENNKRLVPKLNAVFVSNNSIKFEVNEDDLILVTGGAKGITFECVRELGIRKNCKLIILGKSGIEDNFVQKNLEQLRLGNIAFIYYQVDISDPQSCKKCLSQIVSEHGNITGFIHGAGVNIPCSTLNLKYNSLINTLNPKLFGFRNLMAHLELRYLKFVFTFGSIIAETGMEGNADYALANEWLKSDMLKLSKEHTGISFLNLEWSVWGGTGMGHNLGVLEKLKSKGVNPIPLDEGINFFMKLFDDEFPSGSIIVTGRFDSISTIYVKGQKQLPFFRFLDDIKVYYPSVELISDCTLSANYDSYLSDHTIDGQLVFPGVVGLEAMAQAVKGLLLDEEISSLTFKNVELLHPVVLFRNESRIIRIIAQRKDKYNFHVAIRDASTHFLQDHFRAIINTKTLIHERKMFEIRNENNPNIDVQNDLYGSILFHTGIFKRLTYYNHLTPYGCIAKAEINTPISYFSDFLPKEMILNQPVLRDAALHAVQACVPNFTLIPTNAEEVKIFKIGEFNTINIYADEINRDGDVYTYNIAILNEKEEVIEEWLKVKFKVLINNKARHLSLNLLKIVLQRKLDDLSESRNRFELFCNDQIDDIKLMKRLDGKPFTRDGSQYSNAYAGEHEIAVKSIINVVACDIEKVIEKDTEIWKKLLGNSRYELAKTVQKISKSDLSSSATRIWSAIECLRKAGFSTLNSLIINGYENDGSLILLNDKCKIISYNCFVKEINANAITSILIGN